MKYERTFQAKSNRISFELFDCVIAVGSKNLRMMCGEDVFGVSSTSAEAHCRGQCRAVGQRKYITTL